MASKVLKELADSLGLEDKNSRFFGNYHGYMITLRETNESKTSCNRLSNSLKRTKKRIGL